jgi:pimeloyl-ACP methyl ester carboxylesterase
MPPASDSAMDPVVILVHGATLNGRMWAPVRRHLSPALRVVAPDLPGHGSRLGERYTLEGAVAVLAAAARSVAPAPVILAGDSLGAYSSLAAAAAVPQERLKGLVLAGATFNFVGNSVISYVFKGWLFKALAGVFGEQRVIAKLMPKAFGPKGFDLSSGDARAILDAGMSVVVFGQAVQALRGVDHRSALAAIEQPVLILNGDLDRVNVDEEASFLAVAKHASSRRFADCEHGISLWKPQKFADCINQFAAEMFAPQAPIDSAALITKGREQ